MCRVTTAGLRQDARGPVCVLEDRVLEWATGDVSGRAAKVEVASAGLPPDAQPALGEELAERILSPLVENACRYAKATVRLSAECGGEAEIRIVDDGPGVAEGKQQETFLPGRRGRTSAGANGAGLGRAHRGHAAAGRR